MSCICATKTYCCNLEVCRFGAPLSESETKLYRQSFEFERNGYFVSSDR